jgi:hypothetical protein
MKRLLVVEDEEVIARDIATILRDGEYEIVGPAATVQDAFEDRCDFLDRSDSAEASVQQL